MQVTVIQEALDFYVAGDHRTNFYVEVTLHANFILGTMIHIISFL